MTKIKINKLNPKFKKILYHGFSYPCFFFFFLNQAHYLLFKVFISTLTLLYFIKSLLGAWFSVLGRCIYTICLSHALYYGTLQLLTSVFIIRSMCTKWQLKEVLSPQSSSHNNHIHWGYWGKRNGGKGRRHRVCWRDRDRDRDWVWKWGPTELRTRRFKW